MGAVPNPESHDPAPIEQLSRPGVLKFVFQVGGPTQMPPGFRFSRCHVRIALPGSLVQAMRMTGNL